LHGKFNRLPACGTRDLTKGQPRVGFGSSKHVSEFLNGTGTRGGESKGRPTALYPKRLIRFWAKIIKKKELC